MSLPAIRSFRCCGRKLSGPPADPLGKDLIARATSASETCTERGVTTGGGGGILDPGGGDGCFSLRAEKVASLGSARVSSEHAK